jgi:hypothetical protein
MPVIAEESPFSSSGVVDRSGPYPVVRGVLLCGRESKWKRRYLDEAFVEGELKVYEGVPGYLNHHKGPGNRDYEKKLCWYTNPRRNGDGLPIGDQCFNPKHPMTEAVLWDIENRPQDCKLSHVADVDMDDAGDGWKNISKINSVASVDIVTNGGTTNSIWEDAPVKMILKDYAKKIAPHLELLQQIKLKTLVSEEGMAEAPMLDGAPGMEGEMMDSSAEEGIKSAFKSACLAEVEECLDNLSKPEHVKKCLKKLKKYLMAHGDISDEDMGDDDEPEEVETETKTETETPEKPKETKTEEGGKVKKKVKGTAVTEEAPREVKLWNARKACVSEGFPEASDSIIAAVAGIGDSSAQLAFIREQKGLAKASAGGPGIRGTKKGTTVEEGAPQTGQDEALSLMRAARMENMTVKQREDYEKDCQRRDKERKALQRGGSGVTNPYMMSPAS